MIETAERSERRTTPRGASSRRTGRSAARRRHAASFSDAVIAAYIRELRRSAAAVHAEGG